MSNENYFNSGLTYKSAEDINSAMGRVYGHMSIAVIVSMFVSYFVSADPALLKFFCSSTSPVNSR